MLEPHTRLDAMCSEWSSMKRDVSKELLEDVHDLANRSLSIELSAL